MNWNTFDSSIPLGKHFFCTLQQKSIDFIHSHSKYYEHCMSRISYQTFRIYFCILSHILMNIQIYDDKCFHKYINYNL